MFALNDINGFKLADKTLCLTYDDGPGQYTKEISTFLHSKGIRATFFVVGKYAEEHPDTINYLYECGHIVGNHTYEHPDMPYYVSVDGDVVDQIARTNAVIGNRQDGKVFFRAPYGKWSPEVAMELNTDLRSSFKHVGPVHWDIPGIDCYYWKLGKTVDETVEVYLKEIEEKGSGVIVMHDEIADMDIVKSLNKTHLLTAKLIPILLEKGYKFIGLDELKDLAMTDAENDAFYIKRSDGKYLVNQGKSGSELNWSNKGDKFTSTYTLKRTGHGKIQLMTQSGCSITVKNDGRFEAVHLVDEADQYAWLDYIPVRSNQFMLRTFNGNYMGAEKSVTHLSANAPFMRQACIFQFEYENKPMKRQGGFKHNLKMMKKRLLFIKSKILQS